MMTQEVCSIYFTHRTPHLPLVTGGPPQHDEKNVSVMYVL